MLAHLIRSTKAKKNLPSLAGFLVIKNEINRLSVRG